jgi:hypothetical protein
VRQSEKEQYRWPGRSEPSSDERSSGPNTGGAAMAKLVLREIRFHNEGPLDLGRH